MKKLSLHVLLTLIVVIIGINPGYSQDIKTNNLTNESSYYRCEDDLIEVMFVESSAVRIRNGEPTDHNSNATAGLNNVLSALAWHQWSRFCDVDETKLDQWAANGERNTGQPVYNLNNIYSLKIPKGHDIWQICRQLEELEGIYQAKPYPLPVEPPLPPDYQNNQGYLKQATLNPSGIDALFAWTQTGGTGTGITICDLEYSWNYNHADITKAIGSSLNSWADPGFGNDHGTAVIGQLVADNNGWGITGICYDANILTCGTYYPAGSPAWNVPGAMALAISNLSAGDIILLEQQWNYDGSGGYVPIEWWTNTNTPQTNNAVYAAIVNAVANGIHVVEAGGNGNMDTDMITWYGNSGAIIVGAGGGFSYNNRERLSFSSYGSRFDLQGWGQNVTTTGYGTLYNSEGVNYYYTGTFNGTSSASPIVTGALACAEGYYLANISSTPPSPAFMRNHLATYSQPQVFGLTGNIGPRPDLYQAILAFLPPQNNIDWGDAPDPAYPTLLVNNGARHLIDPTIYMGASIDADPDGQPHPNAMGDDNNGNDDEDGVFFTSIIIAGQSNTITVFASVTGFLNAWMDFNANGSWADPGEQVFTDVLLNPGINNMLYNVPLVPFSITTYTRFRFSTQPGLIYTGLAPDGEVEDYEILINEAIQYEFDFGDAPDPTYPTLLANNGAHHFIDPTIFLGSSIDGDPDGQSDPSALGDDNDGNDDEDGVIFYYPLNPGTTATVDVIASGFFFLNAWIDQDFNGSWADPGDHVFMDVPLVSGVNTLSFIISSPAGSVGNTFARFRFSSMTGLSFFGPAPDGEVEDYMIFIGDESQDVFDWGDAPDGPYPTYAPSFGAHHLIVPGIYLGTTIDGEPDGQPDPAALGDDNNGSDDEDGITFNLPIIPNQPSYIIVEASVPGFLNAWIDFNFNGSWADPGDQIFMDYPLNVGSNLLTFTSPPLGISGNTFARFRFSTLAGLSFTGPAPDGEVEDYMIFISEETQDVLDWGDAPDGPYPTFAANSGAHHLIVPGIFLGTIVDADPDGQPNPAALGDDNDGNDDEDGVNFNYPFIPGQPATIDVIASMAGFLNAWIDQDFNGSWADPGDHVFIDIPLNAGTNSITFIASPGGWTGNTFARFRFSTLAGLSYIGPASDGEVEDYVIFFGEETQDEFDFGDASDPTFPTLLANNGARHIIDGITFLGVGIDADPDGQPDPNALGDDNDGNDDEDGVTVIFPLSPGGTAGFDVIASVDGLLNAWIDFNGNGSWADAAEHVIIDQSLFAGSNWQLFSVPNFAQVGKTIARFRFSTVGGLNYDGLSPNGEVEDYELIIHGDVIVKLKVLLEGAYNGAEMTTDLNAGGVLPLSQPFDSDTTAKWYYTGSESVPSIPNADITDWVLVEFRDAPSASSATGSTVVARKAAFLKKDGSITGLDGINPIQVYGVFQYQPFVVIWHRNHLGVLSANPLVNTGVNEYGYEFPTSAGQAFGGVLGHKYLGGGVWGMISADGEPDGLVDADDYLVWRKTLGTSGYDPADYNLDTQVDNKDKNDQWVPNLGEGSQVPN
jgi:hypothetical protein